MNELIFTHHRHETNSKMQFYNNNHSHIHTLEYDEKQTLEPPKWGEDLGQYSCYIEGVLFDNLNYEQYKILSPFSD